MNKLRQYTNGEYFADIDGKRINRKSVFTAMIYSEPYDSKHPFVEYKSRIEHCGSCLDDNEDSGVLDQCCCIHSHFHNKKEENDYVKSIGFWRYEK